MRFYELTRKLKICNVGINLKGTNVENKPTYIFEVLNGPTYSQDDRPPFWENETKLTGIDGERGFGANLHLIPLIEFPLIEDFEVRLESIRAEGETATHYTVWFFSPSHGYLADLWYGAIQLTWKNFQIPIGSFAEPHVDVDQCWKIVITVKDEFVYILEGNDDEEDYYRWFKVNKVLYLAEWQKAIDLCRATFLK